MKSTTSMKIAGKRSLPKQSHIGCLVVHKVCGNHAKGMVREVDTFLADNGVEWTCNRFKAIWTAALHLKNGDVESARLVYQQNSISYHKDTNLPKGEWGYAVENFVKASRPSVQRRWAAVLRYYCSMVIETEEPTPKQAAKALKNVGSPNRVPEETINGLLKEAEYCLKLRGMTPIDERKLAFRGSARKLHGTSYYYHRINSSKFDKNSKQNFKELTNAPYGKFICSLLTEPYVPDSISRLTRARNFRESQMYEYGMDESVTVGRYVIIQQQGCKARGVYQPTAALQLAFYPMHEACQHFADCLYPKESRYDNQALAGLEIQDHLARGGTAYSTDMSAATDRFPRSFSEGLLRLCGLSSYAEALEDVCLRPWECDFSPKRYVYCEAGQPMGLYGSFPLFHFSNLVVADIALLRVQRIKDNVTLYPDGSAFKVVGDDINHSDPDVDREYRNILQSLNVEISETKSFKGQIAEFAGFVCMPCANNQINCFRPYKVPEGDFIKNPLEFIHSLGIKSATLSHKWQRYFLAYERTINKRYPDLSPIYSKSTDELMSKEIKSAQRIVQLRDTVESVALQLGEVLSSQASRKDADEIVLTFAKWFQDRTGYFFADYDLSAFLTDIFSLAEDEWKSFTDYPFSRKEYKEGDNRLRRAGHHEVFRRIQDDPLMEEELMNLDLDQYISVSSQPADEQAELPPKFSMSVSPLDIGLTVEER